ncbi:MAG: sigma-70 family RNA polymerase sigma factor [Planctomycetes bacterium]|nr:sigma-70 family RNA polymerase sigma factor [Planctomycetota bacterium]
MHSPDIHDLAAAACAGDTAAFDMLIERLGRDLRIFVASRAVNQEQMEEICQTTWVTAWEKRATWSHDAPFDSWLRGIARNQLLQDLTRLSRERKRRSSDEIEQLLAGDGLAHLDETTDVRAARLTSCLEHLSPRARTMLLARHGAGESMASLARRFKQPVPTLATALWRLRASIRLCVEGATP